MKLDKNDKSFLKKAIPTTAFFAGLCCFTPVVLVFFGLSSVAFAASLADIFYGSYKWAFRGFAALMLITARSWYFYKKEGICSLDQIKRKRQKIINVVLISVIASILAYIVWLYVIVEVMGLVLGIW